MRGGGRPREHSAVALPSNIDWSREVAPRLGGSGTLGMGGTQLGRPRAGVAYYERQFAAAAGGGAKCGRVDVFQRVREREEGRRRGCLIGISDLLTHTRVFWAVATRDFFSLRACSLRRPQAASPASIPSTGGPLLSTIYEDFLFFLKFMNNLTYI
jgi:hypothetical protein